MWWRRFTQYIKMTQNIDLNIMTTNREILEQYRDELEQRINDLFIWALGESAITEMTRTVRDNDTNRKDENQLYTLFRQHFIPNRNNFHSRADLFGITREKSERAEDVWTQILQVEKKWEFENVTPAELIASNFLSLIYGLADYKLKRIRKSDTTIETITDLIHKYMYDRITESNYSNDGKEIQHIQERQYKRKWSDKSSYERARKKSDSQKPKYKDNRCGQCGSPNWSRMHICTAKYAECRNCKRRGLYEKMC